MCYFISIGIPEKESEQAKQLLSKNYQIEETKNKAFCKELPERQKAYTITKNGCSCDIYEWVEFSGEDIEKEKNKLKKKGWSENKVSCSINDMVKASQAGLNPDLIQNILALLERLKTITIAVHWYGGNIENEEINFLGRAVLKAKDLIGNSATIKPDVIYKISS
jgi:hypothetical protein